LHGLTVFDDCFSEPEPANAEGNKNEDTEGDEVSFYGFSNSVDACIHVLEDAFAIELTYYHLKNWFCFKLNRQFKV